MQRLEAAERLRREEGRLRADVEAVSADIERLTAASLQAVASARKKGKQEEAATRSSQLAAAKAAGGGDKEAQRKRLEALKGKYGPHVTANIAKKQAEASKAVAKA